MKPIGITSALAFGLIMTAPHMADARILEIYCDRYAPMAAAGGQGAKEPVLYTSIAAALAEARSGDTLLIHGTCRENVVISQDRVTLRGSLGATIEGTAVASSPGTVEVTGASDVRLKHLTIVSDTAPAVAVNRTATVSLDSIILRVDDGDGLVVEKGSQAHAAGFAVVRTQPEPPTMATTLIGRRGGSGL